MSRQKICGTFLLAFLMLTAVLLTGCRYRERFPFYPVEKCEDHSEILSMNGVQYVRGWKWDEHAHYYGDGDTYVWTPAEGIGEQIGVCGDEETQAVSLKIYEVAGDGERIFLYTRPAHFYFGGVETRLWMQDGVTLGTPTAETVSSVTLVPQNGDAAPAEVDDSAMLAALLEAYGGDSVQKPTGEGWAYGALIMHHKDFPFLQYEIAYRCSTEQKIVYGSRGKAGEWFVLPDAWYAVIAELDFPARDE